MLTVQVTMFNFKLEMGELQVKQIKKWSRKALDGVIVAVFSFMVLLVFLNAVLRYIFSSGITWSEELSRYSFVWVVFLGALIAFIEGLHIIVDLLIQKFPPVLKKVIFLTINVLVILTMIFFWDGLIKLIKINQGIGAPASGIPENTKYFAGLIASSGIILFSIYKIIVVLIFNKEKPEWM